MAKKDEDFWAGDPEMQALVREKKARLGRESPQLTAMAQAAGLGAYVQMHGPSYDQTRNLFIGMLLVCGGGFAMPVLWLLDRSVVPWFMPIGGVLVGLAAGVIFPALLLLLRMRAIQLHERGLVWKTLFGNGTLCYDEVTSIRAVTTITTGGVGSESSKLSLGRRDGSTLVLRDAEDMGGVAKHVADAVGVSLDRKF